MRPITPGEEAAMDQWREREAERADELADYYDGMAEDYLLRTERPE